MRLLFASIFIATLLGCAIAQSTSPAASPSPSASSNCTTLLLNGTEPFDIFLIGSSLNSSANASIASHGPLPSSSPVLNVTNSLIGGTVAVNGSALIINSLIGSGLDCSASPSPSSSPASSPSATSSPGLSSSANATLLVTGDLNATNTRIACNQQALQVGQNITRSIDFLAVGSRLLNASRDLCQRPSDLQANLTDGRLTLILPSNATELTVINLNASDLSTLRLININASSTNISSTNASSSSNSTSSSRFVIINILGTSSANLSSNSSTSSAASFSNQTSSNSNSSRDIVTLANFALNIEGLNASQLLWNFCNATNIRVEFVRLQGSVLAPQAHLSLDSMGHQGSIVAGSLDASFVSQSSARFGGFFCAASPSPSPSASPSP